MYTTECARRCYFVGLECRRWLDCSRIYYHKEMDSKPLSSCRTSADHPLASTWWVWLYPRGKDWNREGKAGFEKIPFGIQNMEDFLCFFDHFPSLQTGDFFLFRDSIFPEWEAPENRQGGRWSLGITDRSKIRAMWILICEACVAENLFQDDTKINGVELCYKKGYIKLWTKTCPEASQQKTVCLHPSYTTHPSFANIAFDSCKFQVNAASYRFAAAKVFISDARKKNRECSQRSEKATNVHGGRRCGGTVGNSKIQKPASIQKGLRRLE
jgi:hypothetical protein